MSYSQPESFRGHRGQVGVEGSELGRLNALNLTQGLTNEKAASSGHEEQAVWARQWPPGAAEVIKG